MWCKSPPAVFLLEDFELFQSINLNAIHSSVFPAKHESVPCLCGRGGQLLSRREILSGCSFCLYETIPHENRWNHPKKVERLHAFRMECCEPRLPRPRGRACPPQPKININFAFKVGAVVKRELVRSVVLAVVSVSMQISHEWWINAISCIRDAALSADDFLALCRGRSPEDWRSTWWSTGSPHEQWSPLNVTVLIPVISAKPWWWTWLMEKSELLQKALKLCDVIPHDSEYVNHLTVS